MTGRFGDVIASVVDVDVIGGGPGDRVDRNEGLLFVDTEETGVLDEQEADLTFAVVDEHVVHLAEAHAVLVRYVPPAHVNLAALHRGACGLVINGVAHGPQALIATCQLYGRIFADGEVIDVEPWGAAPFPVVKELVVDRSGFDRIIAAGGYITAPTGAAPDA
jgi:hypothetical protein